MDDKHKGVNYYTSICKGPVRYEHAVGIYKSVGVATNV